jgi:8-oxo-dGTP pyrophosphatase MutT (NUDIX family)
MIKRLSSKIVYENPWMKVREDQVEFPNGHNGIYGVVEKDDFVIIIPFDGVSFYLVNQYRYPIEQETWEFPQGKHEGDPNIDIKKLAGEELQEETGLTANTIQKIGFLHEAPGYSKQGLRVFCN